MLCESSSPSVRSAGLVLAGLTLLTAVSLSADSFDPLEKVYAGELRSSVESLMEQFRRVRKYETDDFPLQPAQFRKFQQEVVSGFIAALGMEEWVVRNPQGKRSPIAGLYRDRIVGRLHHDGIDMEAHLIEILATGDQVPAVICLPPGEDRSPAVACYPGHGKNPLRDLVFDRESYQRAIATRLARFSHRVARRSA
jgi:hypothetical protein